MQNNNANSICVTLAIYIQRSGEGERDGRGRGGGRGDYSDNTEFKTDLGNFFELEVEVKTFSCMTKSSCIL